MALHEKRHKMPPHLAEIPYGFKNLWIISVSDYNLAEMSFLEANILSVSLNGSAISVAQMKQLYDFNRDGCSLSQPGMGGLYATITGFDKDTSKYGFHILVEQNLEMNGVLGVSGSMVDNANPMRPHVGHDDTKLDISEYETDQGLLDKRLITNEADIKENASGISNLQDTAITSIMLNGKTVEVEDGKADIEVDLIDSFDFADGLNAKVDKTVAGTGNRIVQRLADAFNASTRTLTLEKNLLSLIDGSTQIDSRDYPLADLLGITALEAIDKGLFYFCADSAITTFSGNVFMAPSSLYRNNPDGTTFVPTTTANIQLVLAVSTDYNGYGTVRRTSISAIGRVVRSTPTALTCVFTNLAQYTVYNRFNSYRTGQIVCDTTSQSMFLVLQNVPLPTVEANTIPITNTQYYAPIKDDTIMKAGTVWANLEASDGIGTDCSLSRVRLKMLELGAGFDEYINFSADRIPAQIMSDADWDRDILLWVTDGMQFTSRRDLFEYLGNFGLADRYKISNNGIVVTRFENNRITITPVFTRSTLQSSYNNMYQPIPATFTPGNIPAYSSAGVLADSGRSPVSFATSAQGDKADSAVQSVTISPGTANGTIRLAVDGNSQNAAVAGLGSAAYTNADSYATSAQGDKADTALQAASISGGSANGTIRLTVNGTPQGDVLVTGINTAAFAAASAFASSAQGLLAESALQEIEISSGTAAGTIAYKINGGSELSVPVSGLRSAAFTESTAFATSAQGILASSALQAAHVVDNLNSTSIAAPLSANQGRILEQSIQALGLNGRPIGGFPTLASVFTNASQYPATLHPIMASDVIYIAKDENYTNQHTQYRVSAVDGNGSITYAFIRILPDALRDFQTAPIQPHEIANGAVSTGHIQNSAVIETNIADNAVSMFKLSQNVQDTLGKADNALQANISSLGIGAVVSSITQDVNKRLTVQYTNAVTSVETVALGDFVTDATLHGNRLELLKDGKALRSVKESGEGNVFVGVTATETEITLTRGAAIQSISSTGSGNVITGISSSGVATRGTVLASISKSGSGNVIKDVTVASGAASLVSGNAVDKLNVTGTGNFIASISLTDDTTITATRGNALTTLPEASTSQQGIVQLNNTLTSNSTTQALTAAQGRALSQQMATNDESYVKLEGNQTIPGRKIFSTDLVVPSKSTIPSTPSATTYATEAQVATRMARPSTAALNNIAVFDSNRNVVDSGVLFTEIKPEAITADEIDTMMAAIFG